MHRSAEPKAKGSQSVLLLSGRHLQALDRFLEWMLRPKTFIEANLAPSPVCLNQDELTKAIEATRPFLSSPTPDPFIVRALKKDDTPIRKRWSSIKLWILHVSQSIRHVATSHQMANTAESDFPFPKFRRVITGHIPSGDSTFLVAKKISLPYHHATRSHDTSACHFILAHSRQAFPLSKTSSSTTRTYLTLLLASGSDSSDT